MKTDRIHFSYITAFLILAIIGLITIKWGAIKELTEYITFALTLTSLVLALLAIVYSFFSNSSMTRNIANLEEASKKIQTNSDLLSSAAENLEKNLQDIPSTLKNIELKTDNTLKVFEEFSQSDLRIKKTDEEQLSGEDEPIGKLLMEKGSIATKAVLLGLKLAFERSRQFSMEDFAEKVDISNKSYIQGFLIALSAIGIFRYEEINLGGAKYSWLITYLNEDIKEGIEKSIEDFVNYYEKEFSDPSFLIENYQRVRDYFQ